MIRSTTILALGCSLLWGAGCVSVMFTDGPGQGGEGGTNGGGGDVISAGGAGGETVTASGAGGGGATSSGAGGGGATSSGAGGGAIPTPVTDIAAGENHTCAVRGGEVYCWGRDGYSGAVQPRPTFVPGLSGSTQLALGARHGCALRQGGVNCWGNNDLGQLGDALAVGLAHVPLPPGVSRVVAGAGFSCALIASGEVYCWGSGAQGQMGGAPSDGAAPPTALSLKGVIRLAAGGRHACAITAPDPSGTGETGAYGVWCWGDNSFLQLGAKVASNDAPLLLTVGADDSSELALGATHSCLRTGKTVHCWGDNADGQLGEQVIERSPTWIAQPYPESFDRVAAGGDRTCGWAGGSVQCWGLRYDDEQSIGTLKIKEMTIGASHSCILTTGGEALCWGKNGDGQLGVDGGGDRVAPTPVVWE